MQLRVLSTLLNEMDGILPLAHVVIIGATNRLDLLDAALLRPGRFDEIIEIQSPDLHAREQVLAIHTRAMPLEGDVQLGQLAAACDGWSGAQIGALCREAGMGALREGLRSEAGGEAMREAPRVGQRHFEAAFERVHGAAA